jgi:hypothetical protein
VTFAVTRTLPGARSSIVDVLIVVESIASLNVAVTVVFSAMPVAPLVGVTDATVGAEVSGPPIVVNDQDTFAASALPAESLARGSVVPPSTIAVYVFEVASATDGVSVAVRVVAL